MNQPLRQIIHENNFWLSTQRCLYWEEEKALVLSDLHFGKTGHFRKAGIAIPQDVYKEDLQRLVATIQSFKAQQLIIVGDLFHSRHNKELEWFRRWRTDLSSLAIQLIKGNHDILHDQWYKETGMQVYEEHLTINGFSFRHDPYSQPAIIEEPVAELNLHQKIDSTANRTNKTSSSSQQPLYQFTGHIHPGISIRGIARQSLHFPCFYFTETHCVLPAFSRFTGTYSIQPQKGDNVYAILKDSLIKV